MRTETPMRRIGKWPARIWRRTDETLICKARAASWVVQATRSGRSSTPLTVLTVLIAPPSGSDLRKRRAQLLRHRALVDSGEVLLEDLADTALVLRFRLHQLQVLPQQLTHPPTRLLTHPHHPTA